MASKIPTTAALACSRSWQVSISSTSTPPSTSARACSSYAAAMSSNLMCPREGSLVVGPIDPATKRGLSFVENCWATSRAIRAHHRSEEHTSELQSPDHLVCRLLLEKKQKKSMLP